MRLAGFAIAALLSVVVVVPSQAQVKASTVPISRDTVTFRLAVGDMPATVTVQNGGLARVSVKNGPAMGLVPTINAQAVEVTVFEIATDRSTGNEGLRQVAKVTLTRGQAVRVDAVPLPWEIEFLDTKLVSGLGDSPDGPCRTCCVTCGPNTFCGCLVVAECGQCCCPSACECPGGPSTAACQAVGSEPKGSANRR